MSRTAWTYIYTVLVGSCLLIAAAWPTTLVTEADWLAFAVLTALAIPTHFFDAVNGRYSYFLHTVFFFAGAMLLPTPLFVLVVMIPHVAEWMHKRLTNSPLLRQWYIQPFNIGTHVIAGISARWFYASLGGNVSEFSFQISVLAPTVAVFAYVAVNHLLVGQVLVLARNVTWRESGALDSASLLTDVVMMYVGFGIAALWGLSPWLMVPAIAPLVLIYRALTVPELQREAQTDEKTGLWNARHFDRLFSGELARSTDQQRPLALVMVDLDLLRNINNTYGHLAGDVVLAGVARIIRENIRDSDFAGRFGGEEFAVVLPGAGEIEARASAERLRRAVEGASFEISTHPTPIRATMSMGFACFPQHATTTKDLIHEADVALYQAKLSGRNRVRSAADVPHAVKLEFDSPSTPQNQSDASAMPSYAAAFASHKTPSEPAIEDLLHLTDLDGVAQNGASGGVLAGQQDPSQISGGQKSPNWMATLDSEYGQVAAPRQAASNSSGGKAAKTSPLLRLLIASVILSAALLVILRISSVPGMDLTALGFMVVLAGTAELFQVRVYGENTVSVSMAITFATAIILGIPGVAVISAVIVAVHYYRTRPPFHRTAFNWGLHVLAGAMPALLIHDMGFSYGIRNLPLLIPLAALATMLYYLIETGLVAAAVRLTSSKIPLLDKWREQFQWLAKHYLVLGLLGLFLTIAYAGMGPLGLLVFALPIFMMHFTQKEYVRGTEDSVIELRRMNEELAVANQTVTNANLAIQRLNDQLFLVLAKIIDARDPYVSGHATQVATYAVAIARELKLPEERVEQVRQAGLLHDIGKIGISDAILNKPSRLTDQEYENIKSHVTLGADFLETCNGLQGLAPFIRHHHEWWDGTGYPSRLKAEKIPLESRILAVCDSVEAMASDRPYQQAMPATEIVPELSRCAGTQFDPVIVNAFEQLVNRKGLGLIVNTADAVTKNRAAARLPSIGGREQPADPSPKA